MTINWCFLIIVLVFIVLDIVAGIMKAIMKKELNSTVMRNGLFHKFAFLIAIALAYTCEYGMVFLDLGFNIPIVYAVIVYICLTETISILENLGEMNPKLTNKKFMQLFASSKGDEKFIQLLTSSKGDEK
mgnify:CR=1 FL=1